MIANRGMSATFFTTHRFEAADKVEWGGMQGGMKLSPEILLTVALWPSLAG